MFRVLAFLLFAAFLGFGADRVGEIVNKKGRVKVYSEGQLSGKVVFSTPYEVKVGDAVKTDFGSMAFLKLLGYDKLVLMENSVMIIKGVDTVGLEGGRAVFHIRKRGRAQGLKVRVRSVIIGVKGTKFAVYAEGDKIGVYLKEGRLSVRNEEGNFVRYRKREEEAFEEYKREFEEGVQREMEEYEKFKAETEREFKEFVKEFELASGQAVIIEGNEVRDIQIPPEIEEEFKLLEMF